MNDNILIDILNFFTNPEHVDNIDVYGEQVYKGDVYGMESQFHRTYISGVGYAVGHIGEHRLNIRYNAFTNKHSFKVSIDNTPAVIMDTEELLAVAKEVLGKNKTQLDLPKVGSFDN